MSKPWFTAEDKAAVQAVLDSGDLMGGARVAAFEGALCDQFGKRHAVCVSSGTAALECAFAATGEGDLIHPHGFIAILSAARAAGRDPKPDHDKGTCTDVLGAHYPENTRVHDCSHHYEMRGDLSCISFNQNKIIACCGGAVLTDDGVAAAYMRQYRNHGREGSNAYMQGRHLRMGEINAALGLSQLERYDEIIEARKRAARVIKYNTKHLFMVPIYGCESSRTMADFRLFDTATEQDTNTGLIQVWPDRGTDARS